MLHQVREKNDKFQQRTLQSMFAALPLLSGDDGGAAPDVVDMEDAVMPGRRRAPRPASAYGHDRTDKENAGDAANVPPAAPVEEEQEEVGPPPDR